jgi:hypothetical protein
MMPIWILSILSGTGKLFLKAWEWITADFWRIFVLVSAVLAFMLWRADARADRAEAATAREIASHRVTLESVKTLRDALDQKNAESLARAKALKDARSEAAQAQADAERRYAITKARIDALRAAVGQNGDDCSVPGEVTDALAGL